MHLETKTFFSPSKTARIFSILQALSEDTNTTQKALAKKARTSGAMVNHYIRDFQDRGWLRMSAINGKSYAYQLTEQGERKRNQLQVQYFQELTQMYSGLKNHIHGRLEPSCNGSNSVALFGVSELSDLIMAVLKNTTHSSIRAIVDQDATKHGQKYFDHIISPPEVLKYLAVDVVIVSSACEQEKQLNLIRSFDQDSSITIVTIE